MSRGSAAGRARGGWRWAPLAGVVLLGLTACRTTEPAPRAPPPVGAAATIGGAATAGVPRRSAGKPATDLNGSAVPEDLVQPALIRGFDQGGATACLPLAPDRRCLVRKDPLAEDCGRIKGEAYRCEDCSLICSKELAPRR